MRLARRLTPVLLALAVVGVVAWVALAPHESAYEGRPLSYWIGLQAVSVEDLPDQEKTREALRAMAPAAIPRLVRMMAAHDSNLKLKLFALLRFFHFPDPMPARYENSTAMRALVSLGPEARAAGPGLADLYRQGYSPDSQRAVLSVLLAIGPSAPETVPTILLGCANTNDQTRALALKGLGDLHPEPAVAVPVLIKTLSDPYVGARIYAASDLGKYGPAAKAAVPALLKLAQDDGSGQVDRGTVRAARQALQKIDPDAAAKAGFQ